MNYLPCRNSSCKSHGVSHPNCHCYDNASVNELQGMGAQGWELPGSTKKMAKGGDVEHPCHGEHKSDCQYFVDGGVVPAEDMPDVQASGIVPEHDLPDQNVVPESDLPTDYGTPGQQLLTGVEGLGQGFAGPVMTGAELLAHKTGLDTALGIDTSAEAQVGRQTENPITHGLTEAGGLGLGLWTGTGEAGLLAKGVEGLIPSVKIATKLTMRGEELLKTQQIEQQLSTAGKIGSSILQGAIQSGAIQAGDETSKYLLGQNNDPKTAGAAILAAGALGGFTGGLFGISNTAISKGLDKLETDRMGSKAVDFIGGIGAGADPSLQIAAEHLPYTTDFNPKVFDKGIKFWKDFAASHAVAAPSAAIQGYEGYQKEGLWGALKGSALGSVEGFLAEMGIKKVGKIVAPTIAKTLASGKFEQITEAINHAKTMEKGIQTINNGVKNLFRISTQQGVNAIATQSQRDKLNEFVENGGVNTQLQSTQAESSGPTGLPGFSEGGNIGDLGDGNISSHQNMSTQIASTIGKKNNAIMSPGSSDINTPSKSVNEALHKSVFDGNQFLSEQYPELNTMLATAKNRTYNYLNSLRPQQPIGQLPFDAPVKDPTAERKYNRALDIAIQPLSVLNHVKEGTLTLEHVQHLSNMYPELHDHLNKKLTEQITNYQLQKNDKPNYKIRQGLSLFMGTALDSSMTPMSIQAAQSTYMQQATQPAPNTPVTKNKRNTSKLGKMADDHMTSDQARTDRLQKS